MGGGGVSAEKRMCKEDYTEKSKPEDTVAKIAGLQDAFRNRVWLAKYEESNIN